MQWYTNTQISSPSQVFDLVHRYRYQHKEHCIGIYLNMRNQVLYQEIISIGTVSMAVLHPREVFEPAIRCLASSVVVVHTHPSGDITPSEQDDLMTKRLIQAGTLLGIELNDHLIVAGTAWYSYVEHHPRWFSRS